MEKRVFISYAWTNDAYQKKVIDLATKLRNDGIDVILDKWDLRTGADRFIFMEKSVNESDKVLILCNKVYKEKADKPDGYVFRKRTGNNCENSGYVSWPFYRSIW